MADLSFAIGELARGLLGVTMQLKVYHWQTPSYARHKASDALVASLTDKTDKIIEVLQGAAGKRREPDRRNADGQQWQHAKRKQIPKRHRALLPFRDRR